MKPSLSAGNVQRIQIPTGQGGIDATVQEMAKASQGIYGVGSPRIRQLAVQIVRDAGVPEKNGMGEVTAIHKWVQNHLRYVKDPAWYEFVTYPETLAFEQADGDCDDHVVLETALLGAIGYPTRFVTVGFNGPAMSHVYLQTLVNGKWLDLDPIVKDKPAGWHVPTWTVRKVYGLNTPNGFVKPQLSIIGWLVAVGIGIAVWKGRKWIERKILRA